MLIESKARGSYRIIYMRDDLTVQSDLTELKRAVQTYIDHGDKNFAFTFREKSYLYTKSLSAIVQCIEMARKRGGKVASIHPNRDIVDILRTINFDTIIHIAPSEESIS